jgi:hypothetical protein
VNVRFCPAGKYCLGFGTTALNTNFFYDSCVDSVLSFGVQIAFPRSAMYGVSRESSGGRSMDALINVVLRVFGIILTGYLPGRFEALGPDSAAALNRFVFYPFS